MLESWRASDVVQSEAWREGLHSEVLLPAEVSTCIVDLIQPHPGRILHHLVTGPWALRSTSFDGA